MKSCRSGKVLHDFYFELGVKLFSDHKMMVSLHFLPTAPGEIGDLDGHAVVFDGEAGEFAQTGPFGCVIDILIEREAVA